MKIFISWSDSKSQEVAKLIQWIPCVIQSVEPYFLLLILIKALVGALILPRNCKTHLLESFV